MAKLKPDALRKKCDPGIFKFKTTDELKESATIIGQERLSASLKFGTDIKDGGYNIFALGSSQTDKQEYLLKFFEYISKKRPTPPDICYINNFADSYQPKILQLPTGIGFQLQKQMERVLENLLPALNTAFETEEYQNRLQTLQENIQQEQNDLLESLKEKGVKQGLSLVKTPAGFTFIPVDEQGEVMKQQDLMNLNDEEREELEAKTEKLQEELQKLIRKVPSNQRKIRDEVKELDEEIAAFAIDDLFGGIRNDFKEIEEIQVFLDNVEEDIIKNVQIIAGKGSKNQNGNPLVQMLAQQHKEGTDISITDRYRVNVLVDNSKTNGAPLIFEDNPTYDNLIGRVEYKSQMGNFTTNFNLIKPGSLHKANGGYLLLDARQVLLEPFAWEGLKRVLKSNELKIEPFGESIKTINTVSLQPEAVKLNIKIVLIGERYLYYMLCERDPEFLKLFKVEADFEDDIDLTSQNQQKYAQLLGGLIKLNKLKPFSNEAVARLVEQGSRMVNDNQKLSTQTKQLSTLLHESNYWAGEEKHKVVTSNDVEKAIDQQIYRSSRIRDRVQESINRGTIFIDTKGEAVGQINGLSVAMIGNITFGQPSRITARVRLGKGDIINIEREVDLSGSIHSKGVLILKGFLGERYAKNSLLALNASLVFEQSYSHIDGDSASCAELYALLSAIGEIPLKQSFSVTGSVNQHGKVQPIGGVNEKIEGFFDVCDKRGLTGEQGVLIPKTNVKNLMLHSRVLQAAKAGKFHIFSVETIDEGMELLTGLKMGKLNKKGLYPEGTINHKITQNLETFSQKRRALVKAEKNN